jgi:hypothetical protein
MLYVVFLFSLYDYRFRAPLRGRRARIFKRRNAVYTIDLNGKEYNQGIFLLAARPDLDPFGDDLNEAIDDQEFIDTLSDRTGCKQLEAIGNVMEPLSQALDFVEGVLTNRSKFVYNAEELTQCLCELRFLLCREIDRVRDDDDSEDGEDDNDDDDDDDEKALHDDDDEKALRIVLARISEFSEYLMEQFSYDNLQLIDYDDDEAELERKDEAELERKFEGKSWVHDDNERIKSKYDGRLNDAINGNGTGKDIGALKKAAALQKQLRDHLDGKMSNIEKICLDEEAEKSRQKKAAENAPTQMQRSLTRKISVDDYDDDPNEEVRPTRCCPHVFKCYDKPNHEGIFKQCLHLARSCFCCNDCVSRKPKFLSRHMRVNPVLLNDKLDSPMECYCWRHASLFDRIVSIDLTQNALDSHAVVLLSLFAKQLHNLKSLRLGHNRIAVPKYVTA